MDKFKSELSQYNQSVYSDTLSALNQTIIHSNQINSSILQVQEAAHGVQQSFQCFSDALCCLAGVTDE